MAKRKKIKRKSKKKVVRKSDSQVVHVRLGSPIGLRKSLLRTAIDSAQLMKGYVELKDIRTHRASLMKELSKVMSDLHKSKKKLISLLPKIKEDSVKKKAVKVIVPKVKKIKKKAFVLEEKPLSEIERLQKELEHIEGKLQSL